MKRRQRQRRITILSVAVVVVVLVIAAIYVLSNLSSGPNSASIGKPVSSAIYQPLYNVATNVYSTALTRASFAQGVSIHKGTGSLWTANGKPIVLYVGADFCPYCGFQRWPLVMALMRFGNFTHLDYMLSSATDVFPNTPTFTFKGSSYTSNYISFQAYEQEDRSRNAQQTVPANYTAVFSQPVSSGGGGDSYPFIDLGNQYQVSGPMFSPQVLANLNWTQVVSILSTNSQLRDQVVAAADWFTAAICNLTGGTPASVCSNPVIATFSTSLVAYLPGANANLTTGIPNVIASAWAKVQYGQMAFRIKTSTTIR